MAKEEVETMTIQSRLREKIEAKSKGKLRVGGDFLAKWDQKQDRALDDCIERAMLEGVVTLKDRHA